MFAGIIETTGKIKSIRTEDTNKHFSILAPFSAELKVDQSIAHDGVCLTVTKLFEGGYEVTAIDETLIKTNLNHWKEGTEVNLERCLQLGSRIDGHMVQGHVDTTAQCTGIEDLNGSWKFAFNYKPNPEYITVTKGSICINGVSLTVVDSTDHGFSVCIIPYTYEHTNFNRLKKGDMVNLEFDIIGKYVRRYMALQTH